MIVQTSSGLLLGPFHAVVTLADHLQCDGVDLPFTVIGAYTVINTNPPGPPEKYSWDGSQYVALPIPSAELAALVASVLAKVDADVDAIYAAAIGNRTTEYQLAEQDAIAYKAAGYTGTVPASVQAWATAKAATATWAADDILSTAAAWRSAQAAIRANRLARKEAARVATTVASLNTISAQWAGFVTAIRSALGI